MKISIIGFVAMMAICAFKPGEHDYLFMAWMGANLAVCAWFSGRRSIATPQPNPHSDSLS